MDLREIRFKRRLTQWEIRKLSGVHQSRISLFERGYINLSRKEKIAIAKALGLDPVEFFKEENQNENTICSCQTDRS